MLSFVDRLPQDSRNETTLTPDMKLPSIISKGISIRQHELDQKSQCKHKPVDAVFLSPCAQILVSLLFNERPVRSYLTPSDILGIHYPECLRSTASVEIKNNTASAVS
ncbi:hypothetical protein SCLCIDRAFT_1214198 [Scleroderma citrinum Foug A]|uniref:Uncharacterized protein n=1 Tax=Scleroderma citrinum Foug A TaxID=1036808 RepID=A0A0C3DSF3_9AGAM|nr:hypothetical protein SCLCIDRAFT_1214198 [Scleroderma citrinum Foug A]